MHEPDAEAQPPQRRRSKSVSGLLEVLRTAFLRHLASHAPIMFDSRNHDSISRPHVVQQKVAKRVKGLAPNRVRNRVPVRFGVSMIAECGNSGTRITWWPPF